MIPNPADHSHTPLKTFTLRVETPDGALPPAQVRVPDTPMGLSDLVPPVYELCNGAAQLAIRRSESEGKPVRCGPGCGACCRQLVPLSMPEAIFLVEYIEQLAPQRSAAIKNSFAAGLAAIEQSGLLDKLYTIDRQKDDVAIALAYFQLGIACPFLDQESCGIHQLRPCACREFNVTSPPAFCADPLQGTIERVTIHRKMTAALAQTAARLLGLQPVLIPFPLIYDWYGNHTEYAALQWKGIGLFELMLSVALGKNPLGASSDILT
jgi:Fe-S-cluster containining protein